MLNVPAMLPRLMVGASFPCFCNDCVCHVLQVDLQRLRKLIQLSLSCAGTRCKPTDVAVRCFDTGTVCERTPPSGTYRIWVTAFALQTRHSLHACAHRWRYMDTARCSAGGTGASRV